MTYRKRASATDNTAVIERLERERDELVRAVTIMGKYIDDWADNKPNFQDDMDEVRKILERTQ